MDKNADRVKKLRKLVDEAGGPAAFARKYSRPDADSPIAETFVSQILNGHRRFGERAARNMESRAGLPEGYFDTPFQDPNMESFLESDERRKALIKLIMQLPEENLNHAKRLLDVADELTPRGEKKKTQGE